MRTLFYAIAVLIVPASLGLGAVHTITNSGFTFSPDSVTIVSGDTVQFVITSMHNAVQVSEATWQNDGNTSNGGFSVPFGGGMIVLTDTGKYYYVCQVHASIGMKGIIVVSSPALLNSLTIGNLADRDGNISTTADRMLKNWSLKLYRDSVGSGVVLDSVASGKTLAVGNLPAGTYVAVEGDSVSWSHVSVNIDGVSQGAVTANKWPITLTSAETHFIDFINFARHTIMNSGFTFVPESLTIASGDTVHFVLESIHTAREVSQSTWLADDTVSNGGFDLPFGGGSAVLPALGTHFYVCTVHASIGMKGRIVVLSPDAFFTVNRRVASGWNMVSLPVDASDRRTIALFPGAISRAFSYEGSYVPQTLLSIGAGYWVKFDTGQTVSLMGLPAVRDTIDVLNGWNMIGSIAVPHPSLAVTSVPAGIIASRLFGYNGSYFIADTILPGGGYWVRVSGQGKLFLDSTSGAATQRAAPPEDLLRGASTLRVRDAAGHEKTLAFIVGHYDEASPSYPTGGLPPIPPPGAFDVRFSSGHEVRFVSADRAWESAIVVSSAAYPITISWDFQPLDRTIKLIMDDRVKVLTARGAIKLSEPAGSLLLNIGAPGEPPAEYALRLAFPNPFNGGTVIRYNLPTESRVLVRVYSVVGQLIAILVDGVEAAGEKSVAWNAVDRVSGVYFIRLDAAASGGGEKTFKKVIKALLQK